MTDWVSSRVGVSVTRGATSAFGRASSGTIDLTLFDTGRIFDPLHAAGPHFGNLLPGVPVRVRARAGAETVLDHLGDPILDEFGDPIVTATAMIPIARGFVSGFPQESSGGGDALTRIPIFAVDGFQNLSRAPVPSSVYDLEVLADNPKAYWKLTDPGVEYAIDSSGNGYDGVYRNEPQLADDGLVFGEQSRTVDGVRQAVDIRDAAVRIGDPSTWFASMEAFTVEAWFRTSSSAASGEYDTIYRQGGDPKSMTVMLCLQGDGKLVVVFGSAGTAWQPMTSSTWNDGEGHHVCYSAVNALVSYTDDRFMVDGAAQSMSNTALDGNSTTGVVIGGHPNPRNTRDYFNGELSHVAIYETALSEARAVAHYEAGTAPWSGDMTGTRLARILDYIGWPADLRAIATGKSQLGPATFEPDDNALNYGQLIERTEDGRLFVDASGQLTFRDRYWPFISTEGGTSQFTFTDDGAGAGYAEFNWDLDDELVINSPRYSRRGGGEVRLDDAASQALYGIREDQQTDLLLGSDAEVRGRAHWTLATRKDAQPRVKRIMIPLHAYSEADQQAVLELELGYRVTTQRTPQGVGSAISREFHVDGIRHQVSVAEWWVELYVSPAVDQDLTLFTLGTSTLGGTHVLAH